MLFISGSLQQDPHGSTALQQPRQAKATPLHITTAYHCMLQGYQHCHKIALYTHYYK